MILSYATRRTSELSKRVVAYELLEVTRSPFNVSADGIVTCVYWLRLSLRWVEVRLVLGTGESK
jgi:hypothetical protein